MFLLQSNTRVIEYTLLFRHEQNTNLYYTNNIRLHQNLIFNLYLLVPIMWKSDNKFFLAPYSPPSHPSNHLIAPMACTSHKYTYQCCASMPQKIACSTLLPWHSKNSLGGKGCLKIDTLPFDSWLAFVVPKIYYCPQYQRIGDVEIVRDCVPREFSREKISHSEYVARNAQHPLPDLNVNNII